MPYRKPPAKEVKAVDEARKAAEAKAMEDGPPKEEKEKEKEKAKAEAEKECTSST